MGTYVREGNSTKIQPVFRLFLCWEAVSPLVLGFLSYIWVNVMRTFMCLAWLSWVFSRYLNLLIFEGGIAVPFLLWAWAFDQKCGTLHFSLSVHRYDQPLVMRRGCPFLTQQWAIYHHGVVEYFGLISLHDLLRDEDDVDWSSLRAFRNICISGWPKDCLASFAAFIQTICGTEPWGDSLESYRIFGTRACFVAYERVCRMIRLQQCRL